METYRVTRCEFLLRPQDRTAALRLVQRRLATNDRLAGGASATGLAPDLRDGVPVIHDCGGICVDVKVLVVFGMWLLLGSMKAVVVVCGCGCGCCEGREDRRSGLSLIMLVEL